MILARVAVKQPIFATMVIAAMIIFGWIAYTRLPVVMFPELNFPYVTITTILPGANPNTVESKVTEVIEENCATLEGVKNIYSYSLENLSQVIIEFELEMDVDVVTQEVRDKIANARQLLPSDIENPLVQKFDFRAYPIIQIAISSNTSLRDLTEIIEKRIKGNIERIKGVGNVTIVGGRERQVRIWLDAGKLSGYGLEGDDVVRTLQIGNIDFPGGTLKSQQEELVVKTEGEVKKVDDFQKLIISSKQGKPVTVGDVAVVEDGEEDAKTYSRLNGKQAVAVLITKRADANEIEVVDNVKEELGKLQETYKNKMKIVIAQDNSSFTRDAVSDVNTTMLYGGFFAVLVVLFFLRNISATLIAGIAIPVSVISTYAFMSLLGFSLNILTMMGLSLSVGVLIDDAIVVIENIFRHREMKEKRHDAAINATNEIGLAVMASTFTVVAVFIPVAFMSGLVGQFFYEFGLTVSVAVMVSLFVSFFLTPMLSSRFLRRKQRENAFDKKFESAYAKLLVWYKKALDWSLAHRWRVVITAFLLMVFSIGFAGSGAIKSEFMGTMERDEFSIDVETDLGSTVEQTDRKIREIESLLTQRLPELRELFATVGVGQGSREESNRGQILIKLTPQEDRKLSVYEIQAESRRILSVVKNAKISTAEASMGSSGGFSSKQFQVLLTGSDLGQLEKANTRMLNSLKTKKGIVDLDSSWRMGKPELHIGINRLKAADLGVNVYGIASVINTLIGGKHVSNFEEGGEQYEVWVRLQQTDREKPQDIDKLEVRSLNGAMIDLGNVTTYERETGPSQIQRYNRRRSIEITSNLENLPLGEAVKIVQKTASETLSGTDIELTLGGEAEAMKESFQELSFTLFLAIILIYMILASQFASFIHPITIMISLPLAIIGAVFGLFFMGKTLSMISFIGIILLMGIVTKNSILLIDLTKQLRDKGMERKKAILTAGPQRLRPILMTALSTIFGALPAALEIGRGAEMRSPMAIAIIGGLITSTFLTLIVIPVVYTIFDDFAKLRLFHWLGGLVRKDS